MNWSWALIDSVLDGTIIDDVTDQLDASTPAVVLLATSGVIALIFILRWMMRFQREFTDFYVEENNKLRVKIDLLEEEVLTKDAKISTLIREQLTFEREMHRQMSAMEDEVAALRRQIG